MLKQKPRNKEVRGVAGGTKLRLDMGPPVERDGVKKLNCSFLGNHLIITLHKLLSHLFLCLPSHNFA
jgi:hypothetical protein